jgi:hypothetical protein
MSESEEKKIQYSKMITEAFQDILKYVAPGQEDIVIQTVNKKLSFALNDSEEKLETMTEALNEAYQQQNDRINQLQIFRDVSAACFHSASILSTVSPGTDFSNFSFVS